MPVIAKKVIYHGRVQGVGFRYRTNHIANKFLVTGYVKNLQDGNVELVVVGNVNQIDDFLSAIRSAMLTNIDEEKIDDIDPITVDQFTIKYDL